MIVVVGLSYRTAPVEVRERLAAGADALPVVLARLAARTELAEVLFLSTCNRVEVFGLVHPATSARGDDRVEAALRAIREELARQAGAGSGDDLAAYLYDKRGDQAIEHVFRVAASLDSMVLGEPQILGQVKDAYEAAVAAGALKGTLSRCVSRAFTVAKRVRTETAIGTGTVSISSVAVDLAGRIFGGLSDHAVLLLGAGEMAEAAARSLGEGARALRICNRSFDRAAALAQIGRGSDAIQELRAGMALARSSAEQEHWKALTLAMGTSLADRASPPRSADLDYPTPDLQPRNGFTVGAYEDEDDLETLCRTYEAADEEGRSLIRLVAELSVNSEKK